ncbi:MAG: hypothetical protein EA428_05510 [Spirochaetaceae bacterium]|nr:MAG: hypothetical protein EA428_05510 [Spirochaetaceae bacterium]
MATGTPSNRQRGQRCAALRVLLTPGALRPVNKCWTTGAKERGGCGSGSGSGRGNGSGRAGAGILGSRNTGALPALLAVRRPPGLSG